jgi:chitinase
VLFLGLEALPALGQSREIIGYYPSWKVRDVPGSMIPERIPFQGLTIINYAFFYPLPDGTVVGRDPRGDSLVLYGTPAAGGTGTPLAEAAHRHGVRVMLSIGGWADSENFPAVAGSQSSRTRFAHSCNDQVRRNNFDGIDIDWEFPGFAEHKGTPADKVNFTLLLRELRDSLDALAGHSDRRLLLTAALPAGAENAAGIDVGQVAGILDFLNIMTYDFYGPWDEHVNHNAPLYAGAGGDPAKSVHGAYLLYTQTFGIPPAKLMLGVPFYGHSYARCTAMNTAHGGTDTTHFSGQGAFYSLINGQMGHFKRIWDDRAKVPYLVSTEWNMLVSYDDEESVRWKSDYAVAHGVRGLIIWEITGDDMPDGSHPLLDVVHMTLFPLPGDRTR